MRAALLAWLLSASPLSGPVQNPISSKVKEHEENITKLKRDIFKVDRAIGETERLITKSRNAPYLADLQFRLAELYVEKSRYVYHLQAESRPEQKGALVSPETRLLKQKAVQIYSRILHEFPDFKDADKVTFFLAHEQRELGEFDQMLKTLEELTKKYPNSPLRMDSEQILGDHFFDKADLAEAERHYRAVLDAPPSPVHDLARYKMGWIRINQSKHGEAVTFFEAAAGSPPVPGADAQKSLNVKREALLDLVYSYTESRPGKGALQYFEKLSESRTTYALALEKLGNRYFIKTQYEFAIPALRKLMEMQPDPELDFDRAAKIYDSLKAAKGKVGARAVDVEFLVRAAVDAKVDPFKDEAWRKKRLGELEEMARDLATQIHIAAQKKDEKGEYLEAAAAYKGYLSLFRPEQYVRSIMRNRAEALFAAKEYPQAARQFEELAQYASRKDPKGYESALYGALLAHFSSLKPGEVNRLSGFEVADARQALKLLGAAYVAKYPRSEHAIEVKFNIARSFYEDGEFERAAELFTAFAISHPDYKDAPAAGKLALDSLRQRNDFKGIDETAKKLLATRLPATFQAEVRKFLTESRSEALGELALKSSQETGDVVEGLTKVAEEHRGQDVGEKALYAAFAAAREKRELAKERELGTKFANEYPRSHYTSDVLLTLARQFAEVARFDEASTWFEQVGSRMRGDTSGVDGWLAAAKLRLALGDSRQAIKDLQAAADAAGSRRPEILAQIAEAHLKSQELPQAKTAAELALKGDRQNAAAAAVLAEAEAKMGAAGEVDNLARTLSAIVQGPHGQSEETARALWYLGELAYRNYKALRADQVEQKVAALQQLEGIYTQTSQMGAPEWIVASLWRLGLAYQHLAEVVQSTRAPAGLSAADAQRFSSTLKEQVASVQERADGAFKACLARSSSMEVFSAAVLGCRSRSEGVQSPIEQLVARSSVAGLEDLQKRVESSSDPAPFESLAMAYLQAHQVPLAQLTFSRAVELQDARASAHNGLGYALLLQGDAMGARSAYQKALESDPTYDKARLNLAALRCRFGDKEGAKRELSTIKDSAALGGPDVDPKWKGCR